MARRHNVTEAVFVTLSALALAALSARALTTASRAQEAAGVAERLNRLIMSGAGEVGRGGTAGTQNVQYTVGRPFSAVCQFYSDRFGFTPGQRFGPGPENRYVASGEKKEQAGVINSSRPAASTALLYHLAHDHVVTVSVSRGKDEQQTSVSLVMIDR